ncbi:hypothetical protein PG993_006979 [Apiospora rasikravindrae]|uniref:Uncharacterized protein n=1 Tax=Apiospora rasikravindrae TaxID=990691 RepID=A0ABR1SYF6_9PEZI
MNELHLAQSQQDEGLDPTNPFSEGHVERRMEEWEATEPFSEGHVEQRTTETNATRQAPPATCSDTETDQKLFRIWDLEVGHLACRLLIQPRDPARFRWDSKTDQVEHLSWASRFQDDIQRHVKCIAVMQGQEDATYCMQELTAV